MAIITCQHCGTTREGVRATTKYCSDLCRVAASRGTRPSGLGTAPKKPEGVIPMTPAPIEGMRIPPMQSVEKINSEAKASNSNLADIPQRMHSRKAELIARMNERLQAKGLPLLQEELPTTEFIRTGFEDIDQLMAPYDPTGWGGIPRGHMTEVYGTIGAGKTSFMKQIANFNTELNVLYFDVENGLTNPPEHVVVSKATLLENIEEIVVEAIDTAMYDLIIVDSVAMMSSLREKDNDKKAMMEKAKAMGQFTRRVNAYMRDDSNPLASRTAVVFVNQLRDTGNSFGIKEFTPGGRAVGYAASFRLELRSAKADKIVKNGSVVGQRVRCQIIKSRWNGEDVGTTVIFPLMFGDL